MAERGEEEFVTKFEANRALTCAWQAQKLCQNGARRWCRQDGELVPRQQSDARGCC
jgi:hypothetical protein